MWFENDSIKKATVTCWTCWQGTYPVHRMKYTKDGRVVTTASAIPLRKKHWASMKKLTGEELNKWRLLVEL